MRKHSIMDHVKVRAILMTAENLEIIERVTSGSIKGIKLPRKDRVVKFVQNGHEYTIEMGEYLVQYATSKGVFFQIWDKNHFRETFKDVDEAPY